MSVDNPRGVCHKHEALEVSLTRIERTTREGFERMNKTLGDIAKDLRDGAVAMGEMRVRLNLLEKVTYSAVGTALTGVLLAILALVLKGAG